MRIYPFILLFFVVSFAEAQMNRISYEDDFLKKNYLGIHAGVAIPLGDFGDKTFSNIASGYANTGYVIDASFRIALSSSWGVAFGYTSCNNAFDAEKLQNDYNAYATKLASQGYPASQYTFGITSNNWQLRGGTIMPVYLLNASKFNIEAGIGGGFFMGTYPSQTLTYTPVNGGSPIIRWQEETESLNWGLRGSLAARYKLFSDIIVSAQLDYYYTDITFKIQNTDYKQPFRILTCSAGIGFQFN